MFISSPLSKLSLKVFATWLSDAEIGVIASAILFEVAIPAAWCAKPIDLSTLEIPGNSLGLIPIKFFQICYST